MIIMPVDTVPESSPNGFPSGRPQIGRKSTVVIPESTLEILDAEAGRLNMPRAELIRQILLQHTLTIHQSTPTKEAP